MKTKILRPELINLLLALVILMAMFGFSAPQAAEASGVVNLVLLPSTSTVQINDTFDITIQAQAGSQQVDGAAIFLDFDPAKLAVQLITNGSAFSFSIGTTFNNTAGTLDYSALTFGPSFPTGTFTIATINFKALAADAGTAIMFHTVLPRRTDVARAGSSVLNTATGVSLTVSGGSIAVPQLVSLAITPALPSIVAGRTQQFTVLGAYSNKSSADITSTVTWTSSNEPVATIETAGKANPGLATCLAAGTTTITAALGTVSAATTLTVTKAVETPVTSPPQPAALTPALTPAPPPSAETPGTVTPAGETNPTNAQPLTTVAPAAQVSPPVPPSAPFAVTNWLLLGGIAAGVLIIGLVSYLLLGRRS